MSDKRQIFIRLFLFAVLVGSLTGCRSGKQTIPYSANREETGELLRGQTGTGSLSPFPTIGNSFISSGATTAGKAPVVSAAEKTTSTPAVSPQSATVVEKDSRQAVPADSDLPRFARQPYDHSLEQLEKNDDGYLVPQRVGKQTISVPPRQRESIVDKAEKENELESRYSSWLENQEMEKKGKENIPKYLQPLSDDREVFDDPSSPFARRTQEENDKRFVRQITAADLKMMSDVSSSRELMDWEKDQDLPIDWSKYSSKKLWNKWRDWAGMGSNEQEAVAIMKQACTEHGLFEQDQDLQHLKKAAGLYEKAGKKWPDSILEEDALFYAGECCFFRKEYTKALRHYKQLVSKYNNTVLKKDAVERLYYIGCYWVQKEEEDPSILNVSNKERPTFSTFSGAKKAFEAIYMNDTSDEGRAPDALFALANAYMRRGVEQGDASFESAARYYRQLYEFYPAHSHAKKAYQLAMLALQKSYRGPLYDNRPLKQAEEIAEAARRTGLGDKQIILSQLDSIKEEQAKYLWTRGQYYEKRGQFASARHYYNRLVREYPGSVLAQDAIKEYQAIEAKPAEVDQHAWLRPIVPFLPKNDRPYYEEPPAKEILFANQKETEKVLNSESTPKVSERAPEQKNSEKKKLF